MAENQTKSEHPPLVLAERWPDGRPIPSWMGDLIQAFAAGVQNPPLQKSLQSEEPSLASGVSTDLGNHEARQSKLFASRSD